MHPNHQTPASPELLAEWAETITRCAQIALDRMDVTLLKAESAVADRRESLERRRQQDYRTRLSRLH